MIHYRDDTITLHQGDSLDVLRTLDDGSVNCCVTSPPYFALRDYGMPGQIGAEKTPAEYVERLRVLFAEVHRVLADDGTLWLNLGDSYASAPKGGLGAATTTLNGSGQQSNSPVGLSRRVDWGMPNKNLAGIPWLVAFALRDAGWFLRRDIIWAKVSRIKPEAVRDRPSTAHEYVFLFTKSPRYWYDPDAIRLGEPGPNARSVWTISSESFPGAHFATMPAELARRCIVAGCKPGGVVLDPFHGSGTTGMVATRNGRKYVGIELNREYLDLSLRTRLADGVLDFDGEAS